MMESGGAADRSATRRAIDGCDCMQGKLTTELENLQVAKRGLTAAFDCLKQYLTNVQGPRLRW